MRRDRRRPSETILVSCGRDRVHPGWPVPGVRERGAAVSRSARTRALAHRGVHGRELAPSWPSAHRRDRTGALEERTSTQRSWSRGLPSGAAGALGGSWPRCGPPSRGDVMACDLPPEHWDGLQGESSTQRGGRMRKSKFTEADLLAEVGRRRGQGPGVVRRLGTTETTAEGVAAARDGGGRAL
jgi:hypothetical protein